MADHVTAPPIPIVALDVPTLSEARALVDRLGSAPDYYKVGLQLYTREGPAVVDWLRGAGKRVFLDLKLLDIPNTVRGAAASAASMGVDLLTVHALGGDAMVKAAVDGAGGPDAGTGVLVVTVLTSFDAASYADALGVLPVEPTHDVVQRFAARAAAAKARGVVCAGDEAAAVRAEFGPTLGTMVPGLRLEGGDVHDQARVVTPADVRRVGATWVVVGRAVTGAADPAMAYQAVQQALTA